MTNDRKQLIEWGKGEDEKRKEDLAAVDRAKPEDRKRALELAQRNATKRRREKGLTRNQASYWVRQGQIAAKAKK